ncbi:hypothetical protein V5O48_018688 [Marasmius crinis-equi]|uniref:Uncharacterized protein n=1 Tax=Marasmius crinis-equi TaxID=585013 RepID=A0ABR3EKK6_9AGAR
MSQAKEADAESETLELSEFHEVKRGDIRIIKEIARHTAKSRRKERRFNPYWRPDRQNKEETGDCDHVIYAAELNVVGPLVQGSRFTVKTYHGSYALEANGSFRLQSLKNSISDSIGCGSEELVPAAHILDTTRRLGGGFLKELYIAELLWHLGGYELNEVWIDPSRGVLCRGLVGPECKIFTGWTRIFKDIPSDVDFLKEDVFIRFAASVKSRNIDELLVGRLAYRGRSEGSTHRVNQPTVITPSNTPIAFGPLRWRTYDLHDESTELENGTTRWGSEKCRGAEADL